MSNDCSNCNGKRTIKVVDKHDSYKFIDIPCPKCAASGWSPVTPEVAGMYLCSRCGKRKYDYRYIGLRCADCEIDKIMEYNHNRAKAGK